MINSMRTFPKRKGTNIQHVAVLFSWDTFQSNFQPQVINMKVSLSSSILLVLVNLALSISCSQALSLETASNTGRRSLFASAVFAACSVAALPSFAEAVGMGTVGGDPSVFCGTYSDPINHPGGKRIISLLEGGNKTGDYQLAQVQGGGGIGEPDDYILPAVILGDRSIIIDFSAKGGPRDFVGVLDIGIKFLRV